MSSNYAINAFKHECKLTRLIAAMPADCVGGGGTREGLEVAAQTYDSMREGDRQDAAIMADLQNNWHIQGPYPHHAMYLRAFVGISQDHEQIEIEIARAECYAEQRAERLREDLQESFDDQLYGYEQEQGGEPDSVRDGVYL